MGMDAGEQLKDDLQEGRIDANRLVDLIVALRRRLEESERRVAELEKQLAGSPTTKVNEPFSLRAEEKRQESRGRKKPKAKRKGRRGRITTEDKLAQAERSEEVVPDGLDKSRCQLSHRRPVWRLEKGRAVLIAYHIYRGPKNQYGKIPGVLGRSEFGQEIVVAVAFLVYVVGLSFDKVCAVFGFFQNLKLGKAQADALLHQLARHWQNEFEVLCTLLANSLVVHTDETGWSLNSVWAFLSEKARLLFFGVHKDADTLKQILDPATFAGLVISDDAAIYANFTQAQKCWAHLLRKAIKLTLQDPHNLAYRRFTDRLLEIYRAACRVQRDGRLGDAGRTRKIAALDDAILELCGAMWAADLPPIEGPDNDYRLLCNEIMRLMIAQQLFVFVTVKPAQQPNGETLPVGATNNEAERTLRKPAEARKTGRTNKTLAGARRQTIVTSVLESLRLYLTTFTLANVIAEIQCWVAKGQSCFTELLKKLKIPPSQKSVLDHVLPQPSG
jgi:transposase